MGTAARSPGGYLLTRYTVRGMPYPRGVIHAGVCALARCYHVSSSHGPRRIHGARAGRKPGGPRAPRARPGPEPHKPRRARTPGRRGRNGRRAGPSTRARGRLGASISSTISPRYSAARACPTRNIGRCTWTPPGSSSRPRRMRVSDVWSTAARSACTGTSHPADRPQRTRRFSRRTSTSRRSSKANGWRTRPRGAPASAAPWCAPEPIYGPGDGRLLKLIGGVARRRFRLLGDGLPRFQMVYVDDLIEGFRLAGARQPGAIGRTYIITGQEAPTLRELVDEIADAAQVPPPRLRLPVWPFWLLGAACEAVCIPFGIEPPISPPPGQVLHQQPVVRYFAGPPGARLRGPSAASRGPHPYARLLSPSGVGLTDRRRLGPGALRQIGAQAGEVPTDRIADRRSAGGRNLDVGADNGVISYLLRRRGGRGGAPISTRARWRRSGSWWAARCISSTVPGRRSRTALRPDRIVDYLEHIPDDRAFALELERILVPGGTLVVNVPHLQPGSPLNRFRHRIGPRTRGMDICGRAIPLRGSGRRWEGRFAIERAVTYSRFGSELVDTALNGMFEAMRKRTGGVRRTRGPSSPPPSGPAPEDSSGCCRALPGARAAAATDGLLPWQPGHKLIVRARLLD